MGLFDKFTGGGDIKLTPRAALGLAAMTVIGADGSIDDEEINSLIRILRGDQAAFQAAFKVYKAKKVSECIPIVTGVLNQDQRAATMANLLDIAMADGVLAGDEETLLQGYIQAFGIPEKLLNDIIEVIALKNKVDAFT
jgi:uncharacterized tellurite resistance protein B-like protein